MFSGSIVALVTPMTTSGAIDFDAMSALIEWHLRSGTSALVILGTTGEGSAITADERAQVIKHAVQQVRGQCPVVVGTGCQSTSETLKKTEQAMILGADAALVVTPPYVRATEEGLYHHYKAISDQISLPILAYNVPTRTATDMPPRLIERLAELPHLVGLKEVVATPERFQQLSQRVGDKLALLSGDDPTAASFVLSGARGVISVAANVAPSMMAELMSAALSGDRDAVARYQDRLVPLFQCMSLDSNPTAVKWVLHQMNKIPDGIRLPLLPLSQQHHAAVQALLDHLEHCKLQENIL